MVDSPDIIRTDIIKNEWDAFWQQITIAADDTLKAVLVISAPYQPGSGEEVQLHKMLQACTLTTERYQTIQLEDGQNISWNQLREKLNPKAILLIGILPQQLGISALLNMNHPNHFNDCIWIPTLSIGELEKQPEMKKQLWNNGLRPVFVDKSFGDLIS